MEKRKQSLFKKKVLTSYESTSYESSSYESSFMEKKLFFFLAVVFVSLVCDFKVDQSFIYYPLVCDFKVDQSLIYLFVFASFQSLVLNTSKKMGLNIQLSLLTRQDLDSGIVFKPKSIYTFIDKP